MPSILPHLTFDTAANPRHSIIWLHGLGADGEDFLPLAQQMQLPLPLRYIFPHAPLQAVTMHGGAVMRSWYDLLPSDLAPELNHGRRSQADATGIRAAQIEIEKLIAQEHARGVPFAQIYLAGFSQGGALALHTGLRQTQPLGGLLALSTYLPLAENLADEMNPANQSLPIFMAHGRQDPIVSFTFGVFSKEMMLKQGLSIDWHEYAMLHTVCEEEVRDIETWLSKQMRG